MSYMLNNQLEAADPKLFGEINRWFGFVPNFYRAQAVRPDLIDAQFRMFNVMLLQDGALSRKLKEYVFLVCSAANLSTYCVTVHCEMVRMLGVEGPDPEQIAIDHTSTNLPMAVKALLSFAAKLNSEPTTIGKADVDALRTYGYGEEQILEAVLMVATAKFSNFTAFGLGTVPDFDSSQVNFPFIRESHPRPSDPVL